MESMESTSHSIWILWNDFWLSPQPFFDSTGPMDSTWNGHIPPGILDHSSWIPDGFHRIIPTIPYGFQWIPWNHSMWIPWNDPYSIWIPVDSIEPFHMDSNGFHGMVYIPYGFQVDSRWIPWNGPYSIWIPMDSMEPFHVDSSGF